MHTHGEYKPGESSLQWRGEGTFTLLRETADLFAIVPPYTFTGMVATRRLALEKQELAASGRKMVSNKSSWHALLQKTRLELENGQVTHEELESSVCGIRFRPSRIEFMSGSPGTMKTLNLL